MKNYNPEAFDMECFFAKVRKGEYKHDRNSRTRSGRDQTEREYTEPLFKKIL